MARGFGRNPGSVVGYMGKIETMFFMIFLI
jgi:hypothetical protein